MGNLYELNSLKKGVVDHGTYSAEKHVNICSLD